MKNTDILNIIEGALLVSNQPLSIEHMLALFSDESIPPTKLELKDTLDQLSKRCEKLSFELKQVSSGYRLQIRQQFSPWISRLWEEKPQKYTRALLETLAIITYKQPITRGEIEDIRGVSVSSQIIRTLKEREWIRIIGHRDMPGRPALFATTKQFLDYFNLQSLNELPTLAEIRNFDEMTDELQKNENTYAEELLVNNNSHATLADNNNQSTENLFAELDAMESNLPDNFKDIDKNQS